LYFSLPCGQGLQSVQLLFSLPCGQGLQFAHLCFSLPCGQGLQSAHLYFLLPCEQRLCPAIISRGHAPWARARERMSSLPSKARVVSFFTTFRPGARG
jgi:hypothetical protein